MTADDWNRRSVLKSWAISRTRRWKGSFRMRSSVDFSARSQLGSLLTSTGLKAYGREKEDSRYRLISRRATVPGLYLWGFLTPPVVGAALFLAALVATETSASTVDGMRASELTLLAGRLATGGLAGGLLGAGHCVC